MASGLCDVKGCTAASPAAVIYTVHSSKDSNLHKKWLVALNLDSSKQIIRACQRHFPAGAPTKNNLVPNSKLFNPLPKQTLSKPHENNQMKDRICNSLANSLRKSPYLNKESLSSAVDAPSDSFVKLAPNATLIDLKKIRQHKEPNRLFRIEDITFLLDEEHSVKVVDHGLKSDAKKAAGHQQIESNSHNLPLNQTKHSEFKSSSLQNSLDLMRQLKIDCNMILVDTLRRRSIQVHRAVLVAKSPYFYREAYLRHSKRNSLHQPHRFTLPSSLDFDTVEAVITLMYTGRPPTEVRKVLTTFEMDIELQDYETTFNLNLIKEEVPEDKIFMLPLFNVDETEVEPSKTSNENRHNYTRKRKRKIESFGDSSTQSYGKMKVSVQKIVERALNPFLGKIYELFASSANALQIAKSSQHIITLWHSDILLTKIFNQTYLTKFFSEVMSEIFKRNLLQASEESEEAIGNYIVETLSCETGNSHIDKSYSNSNSNSTSESLEALLDMGEETSDSVVLNINDIPCYVHLISVYRFNISMKKFIKQPVCDTQNKDSFITPLLSPDVLPEDPCNVLGNMVDNLGQDVLGESSVQDCFQHINEDLKKKVINDLELHVNPLFHEELIMHILVDQVNDKDFLPFSIAVFLSKGCSFCRKKECKIEDLSTPIAPNNPVCPDRQCIKRNLLCDICDKQMANSKSLARHKHTIHDIQTGDQSGLYICSHCGETFKKKWKLNVHERLHEERKRKIACQYCQKILHGSTALRKHVNMVHETKPRFSCDVCNKHFKRREALTVHKRIHTGEKPFECVHCDYASETKGNLKAHILRRHKSQCVTGVESDEPETDRTSHDPPRTMPASIVAHSLSDGSFIITSGNSHADLVS